MPNWCNNTLKITTTDVNFIEAATAAYKNNNLLNFLVPIGEWDYNLAVEKWGTKWDVEGLCDPVILGDSVTFIFDSAWAPPMAVYDALVNRGFGVEAFYWEPGMGYCGVYRDGDDECTEYSSYEEIPEEIVEHFDIEDWTVFEDEDE
jgi:hypothetical protein